MAHFFVNLNAQPNGDHEVHEKGCFWLGMAAQTRDLGDHATCVTAVATAKEFYTTANGCVHCAPACHTG
jgi:hypothetical protein